MFDFSIFSVAFFLAFGVCCPVSAGEPEEKSVVVSMVRMQATQGRPDGKGGNKKSFTVRLLVKGQAPWTVAYCDLNAIRLTLEDSEGIASPSTKCRTDFFYDYLEGDRKLSVLAESWLPSLEAAWVRVKGEIPVVISSQVESSERVTIPLKKGASVPLVLKNAHLAEEDGKGEAVKTELLIKEYEQDEKEGEVMVVTVRLKSPVTFGWRDFDLMTAGGEAVVGEWGRGSAESDKEFVWDKVFRLKGADHQNLKVAVRYASGLKKLLVPVDMKAGLSGFMAVCEEEQINK